MNLTPALAARIAEDSAANRQSIDDMVIQVKEMLADGRDPDLCAQEMAGLFADLDPIRACTGYAYALVRLAQSDTPAGAQ